MGFPAKPLQALQLNFTASAITASNLRGSSCRTFTLHHNACSTFHGNFTSDRTGNLGFNSRARAVYLKDLSDGYTFLSASSPPSRN